LWEYSKHRHITLHSLNPSEAEEANSLRSGFMGEEAESGGPAKIGDI